MLIVPGALVAPSPVNEVVLSDRAVGDPTAPVAETPVNPITSAGAIAPTAAIAESPVKVSVAESTLPQPFSPQSKVPQPGFISGAIAPTAVVAETPVRETTRPDSPQFS